MKNKYVDFISDENLVKNIKIFIEQLDSSSS